MVPQTEFAAAIFLFISEFFFIFLFKPKKAVSNLKFYKSLKNRRMQNYNIIFVLY